MMKLIYYDKLVEVRLDPTPKLSSIETLDGDKQVIEDVRLMLTDEQVPKVEVSQDPSKAG